MNCLILSGNCHGDLFSTEGKLALPARNRPTVTPATRRVNNDWLLLPFGAPVSRDRWPADLGPGACAVNLHSGVAQAGPAGGTGGPSALTG